MRHLTPEALARLVDEPPSAAEAAHLEACDDCRAELAAMRAQTTALGELPDPEPSADGWSRLAARLEADGLMDDGAVPIERRASTSIVWMRRAAALALFLLGGLTGFVLRGTAGPAAGPPVDDGIAAIDARAPAITIASARTPEEAAEALRAAESAYRTALSRFSEMSGDDGNASDPVARLAALQGIVLTTREALRQAPADPLINGYHLAAAAQRDAMIRQLAVEQDDPWF